MVKRWLVVGLVLVGALVAGACTDDELKACLDAGYTLEYCQGDGGGTGGGGGIPGDNQQQ